MVNHFSSDLGILKIRLAATFRIAGSDKGIPAIGDRRGEAVPASGVNGAAGTGNMDPTPNPL